MNQIEAKRLLDALTCNKQIFEELSYELKTHQNCRTAIENVNTNKDKSVLLYLHNIKENQLTKKVERAKKLITDTEVAIENLQQPCKSILYFRYVKHFSYEKISNKLNYSVQRIYQLHNVALKQFSEQYTLLQSNQTNQTNQPY